MNVLKCRYAAVVKIDRKMAVSCPSCQAKLADPPCLDQPSLFTQVLKCLESLDLTHRLRSGTEELGGHQDQLLS